MYVNTMRDLNLLRRRSSHQSAFTLTEVLIVVSLLVILILVGIAIFRPGSQMEKVWDIKRKQELAILTRVFDDYYNDHEKYPTDQDVCYNRPVASADGSTCYCNICGLQGPKNQFGAYLQNLYCDPQHPQRKYLYSYDCSSSEPTWFRVCAKLSFPDVPIKNSNYNYGVSSSNVSPNLCYSIPLDHPEDAPTALPETIPTEPPPEPYNGPLVCPNNSNTKYCLKGGICNICGDESNCHNPQSCDQPLQLYLDSQCKTSCQ